jgi:hypothetical protein
MLLKGIALNLLFLVDMLYAGQQENHNYIVGRNPEGVHV